MEITDSKGSFSLHNGVKMPYLGLGVFQSKDGDEVINAIHWAIDTGYRHIDTAAIYGNEKGVGRALKESDVPREEIFVVSKVWNSDQGFENTLYAYEQSLKRLQLDYLDLYLVHWPVKHKYKETWRALEKLYTDGRIRAIGVSNFMKHHLDDLLSESSIIPMVNQMEFHPCLVQQELLDFCNSKNIQYEAWSPIMKGEVFQLQLLQELASKYGKTIPQITLRWDLQKGVVTIPKSSNKLRIELNAKLFDFVISQEDMHRIDELDRNQRTGPDPNNFNF